MIIRKPIGICMHRALMSGCAILCFAGQGVAQEQSSEGPVVVKTEAAAEAARTLDAIRVTTQRRETTIQEIPASVTAFSSDRLSESNTDSVEDLQFLSAGVNVGKYLSTPLISARSIGNDSITPVADGGVGVYLDGVYLGRRPHQGAAFFDLERIEVLKGPQGSLYGRNATGGAINVISKAPADSFEGGISATLGTDDLFESEGFLSGPLVDSGRARGRIAFRRIVQDGFTPALAVGEEYDDQDEFAVRGKLVFDFSEAAVLQLSGDFNRDESTPAFLTARSSPSMLTVGELLGGSLVPGRATNGEFEQSQLVETWGLGAKLELDLGVNTLTIHSAYRDMFTESLFDLDGTEVLASAIKANPTEVTQFSQDLILSGGTEALDWVFGLQYFEEKGSTLVGFPNGLTLAAPDFSSKTIAGFGELTMDWTERLRVTVGGRVSRDKKDLSEFIEPSPGLRLSNQVSDEWTSFTPRVSLTYDVSDTLTSYATVGTGFKSGTFNLYALSQDTVEPEEVINYEVGLKGSYFDQRLSANVSAFWMDYKDLQVFQTRSASTLVENAADASIKGVEIDMRAHATDVLTIDANLSYIDAEYEDFFSEDALAGNMLTDLSGKRLTGAPEFSANVGASVDFSLWNSGDTRLRVDYRYQDDVFFRPFNDALTTQEAHGWLNANLAVDLPQDGWSVEVFGKNLTDELVFGHQFLGAAGLGTPVYRIPLAGKTVGVRLSYEFGTGRS